MSLFERSDGVICVLSLSDSIFAIMLNGQMFSRVAFVKFMFQNFYLKSNNFLTYSFYKMWKFKCLVENAGNNAEYSEYSINRAESKI